MGSLAAERCADEESEGAGRLAGGLWSRCFQFDVYPRQSGGCDLSVCDGTGQLGREPCAREGEQRREWARHATGSREAARKLLSRGAAHVRPERAALGTKGSRALALPACGRAQPRGRHSTVTLKSSPSDRSKLLRQRQFISFTPGTC